MAYPPFLAIPIWAGAITFALFLLVFMGGGLIGTIRKPKGTTALSVVGGSLGGIVILGIPTGIVTFIGIVALAILVTLDIPPIAYLFLSLAGLVMFDAALRAPSGGMEGCNKMVGLFGSVYLVICGGVAFWMTGGSEVWRAELASLRWLQPVIAALPFATAVALLGNKDQVRLFLGFLGCLAAPFALVFFPVEDGFAAAWLPRTEWLRFPLAGAGTGAVLGLLHLFTALRTQRHQVRARDVRRLVNTGIIYALVGMLAGLVWAAARAFVTAF
ncbi:MAG: hypothetical protein ACXWUX_16035 [Allosphingosinicella sp.]